MQGTLRVLSICNSQGFSSRLAFPGIERFNAVPRCPFKKDAACTAIGGKNLGIALPGHGLRVLPRLECHAHLRETSGRGVRRGGWPAGSDAVLGVRRTELPACGSVEFSFDSGYTRVMRVESRRAAHLSFIQ